MQAHGVDYFFKATAETEIQLHLIFNRWTLLAAGEDNCHLLVAIKTVGTFA